MPGTRGRRWSSATVMAMLALPALLAATPALLAWAGGRELGRALGPRLRDARQERDGTRKTGPQVGEPAPETMLETLDGDPLSLARLKGKVVVVDFWASWCGPCVAAVPSLKRLAQIHGDGPFALVSISGDRNGRKLREFVANHELNWTQCWDGNGDAQRLFGVRGFPTYFVLDPAGRVRYVKSGWDRHVERELSHEIDQALKDAATANGSTQARLRFLYSRPQEGSEWPTKRRSPANT